MKLTLLERDLLNSLLLYLSTRRTALRSALQMRVPLSAEQAEDLRIHYSNYFINLLSAIEAIREDEQFEGKCFADALESSFSFVDFPNGADNYAYIRELRNAIVHRGLNIFSAAHFPENVPLLVAPNQVTNRSGSRKYDSFSFYVLGVIERCESVVGSTIEAHLEKMGLFEKSPDSEESLSESLEFIESSAAMPEWAKKMAQANLEAVDFHVIHQASIAKLQEALKPHTVLPLGLPNPSFNTDWRDKATPGP